MTRFNRSARACAPLVGLALLGTLAPSARAQEAAREAGVVDRAVHAETSLGDQLVILENLYISTVGPTVTLHTPGVNGGPAFDAHLYSGPSHFRISEAGVDGEWLHFQSNVWPSSRKTFLRAPFVVSPLGSHLSPPIGSDSLTVRGSASVAGDGNGRLTVYDTATQVIGRNLLRLINNGPATFRFENAASQASWGFGSIVADDKFFISKVGASGLDLTLDGAGNMVLLGTLTQLSDRNAKRDVRLVDESELLAKLDALPLSTWSYKADENAARHIGPMAQDFASAFGFGHDDTHVAPSDVAGVGLAAVQALQRATDARLAAKEREISSLAERLAALEQALALRSR